MAKEMLPNPQGAIRSHSTYRHRGKEAFLNSKVNHNGVIQGKYLKQTSLLQNSGSSPSSFLGVELREWLQSLPNRDFILRRGRSS